MSSKQRFFSKRVLVITFICSIALYLAAYIGYAILIDYTERQKLIQANAKYDAEQAKLTKTQISINKAIKYLKDNDPQTAIEQKLVLDYLHRKFKLDSIISAEGRQINIHQDPRTYPQEIHFLARIAYPEKLVSIPPKSIVDGPALTNIYSVNCDRLALPPDYWPTMEQGLSAGGYGLTHVFLALVFMKDNGCTIPAEHSDMKDRSITGMVKLVKDKATTQDLRYESIAFLQLAGRSDLVDPSWIDQIMSEQNDDGGWKLESKDTRSSDHATVLALWALLEYENPNTPYEPIIRRPAKAQT